MEKKLIINVGRQLGSGGRCIAKALAEEFNCRFYDKEILNLAAKESGFSEKSPEGLYQFQSDVIRKTAEENLRCVFVGRTADYILRDNPNVINIFITAEINFRAKNVTERLGCTMEEAFKVIENKESERAKYYNYYTGKTWGHAESYDLCADASILGVEETKDFIAFFIRKKLSLE